MAKGGPKCGKQNEEAEGKQMALSAEVSTIGGS
jgi:hypothetical protein